VATALTLALVWVGEAEPARALGEDTVQRCRRALGPDHPITLWVATGLTLALAVLTRDVVDTRRGGLITKETSGRSGGA
jgi:hypothetical protein